MHKLKLLLLLVLGLSLSNVSIVAQQVETDHKTIETRCLNERIAIKNGHMKFDVATTSDHRKTDLVNGKMEKYESHLEFNFTPVRLRLDQTLSDLSISKTPMRHIECNNFDGKGKDFQYVGDPKSVALQGKNMYLKKELNRLFDPRLLGYVCNNLNALRHRRYHLEDTFGEMGLREKITMESRIQEGEMLWEISWIQLRTKSDQELGLTDRRQRRVTIATGRGYNIVKSTTFGMGQNDNIVWRKELSNTLKKFDGVWFVSGYTFTSSGKNSPIIQETMLVTEAWFNRIDPLDAFEVKSFGLKPGHGIYDKDLKKRIIFDGDNVRVDVAEELAKVAANATPLAPIPGTINYWLVAVCIGAAGVGALLIFRLLQKGRANAGS